VVRLCSATTNAGDPCKRPAQRDGPYCLGHDPARGEERRRMSARGGRTKGNPETRAIKRLLGDLTTRILSGDVEPPIAHAVIGAQNTILRCIEIERRLEESDVREEWEQFKAEIRDILRNGHSPGDVDRVLRALVR
jgi:hypothetical protein